MGEDNEPGEGRPVAQRPELSAADPRFLQAQKMEAVGRLAAGVAHDFNNLLQAMVAVAHIMRRHAADPGRVASAADELERHIASGARLAGQLLVFARDEPPVLRRDDLGAVVRAAAEYLRRLVREDVAFRLDLADSPLPAQMDRWQAEQLLVNLVVNAVDAMPDGGRLTVRSGGAEGEQVWLEVEDTGCGMAPEVAARVFEPFFTTKARSQGTGLGLAMVQRVVSDHGGSVTFTTAEGRGTTFRVTLPWLDADGEAESRVAVAPAEEPVGRGARVLLVEDDEGVRLMLEEVLPAFGFAVAAVRTGEEALEADRRSPCDVLVADYVLPGISGLELAGLLRSQRPGLRVVLLSGYAEEGALKHVIGEGRVRFLRKPCGVEVLAQAICAALSDGPAEV